MADDAITRSGMRAEVWDLPFMSVGSFYQHSAQKMCRFQIGLLILEALPFSKIVKSFTSCGRVWLNIPQGMHVDLKIELHCKW